MKNKFPTSDLIQLRMQLRRKKDLRQIQLKLHEFEKQG
jgi:hypothetical protein